ncbi:DAK2 domain-containing protein [Mycoplasmopsis verecunda]|uniref:DhaL domain-containing protein n=1 Tax=Mycoplasmopsis verecunda TaxID=171291 RepID=A0A1T4KYD8_9BACT|nr:DAK2 domain-containing protein [Mycoplasmopsis verecunda]WPB54351.1 DAK2 domain-containing protein [Mycoplasmopsis verecunda]SJZ47475.1 hypothetical protein SAMN02745154_00250 [Mycoplasmopsis verecunda]
MQDKKILTGEILANALISGANALINAKNRIDALNVFPVPDGDTGTNMASTISATISNLENNKDQDVSTILSTMAHDMIYEARGNSGVILSQIFKGFALGTTDKKDLNTADLIKAFEGATARAYKSVFKPVEGTILTVIRETTEYLKEEFKNKEVSYTEFFDKVLQFARKSCDETPNKLKTLREVGVTDSGGEGLYTIFWGVNEALNDRFVEISESTGDINNFISETEVYEGEFGYCTEVLIDLDYPEKFDKESFTKRLEKIANSLVVVNDDNLVKVHGHAVKPGKLLNLAQEYGEFIKIKSENMTLQANYSKANAEKMKQESQDNAERRLCGVVSCNLGSGIVNKMKELGCDFVVESGQTQNPSAQDLINAIDNVNAETVFILTNNSNIILVAQQVAQVVDNKNIVVVPTKSQMQGITAMINFNHDISAEENLEMIEESIETVVTGEVTKAIRNTTLNGVKIRNGSYLAIVDGKIISSHSSVKTAVKAILKATVKPSTELVSLYYGDESSQNEAEEISNYIDAAYNCEVEIVEGNQPTYQLLIGIE